MSETQPLLSAQQNATQVSFLARMAQQVNISELSQNDEANDWEEWKSLKKNDNSQDEKQDNEEMIKCISNISDISDDDLGNKEAQAALGILLKKELLNAANKKAKANIEFIKEIFEKMNADTQKQYWHYLSDEKRLYLLTHDYAKQDITSELCQKTEAGKRFAIMINKIMTNNKIPERKRNAKLRKMWYAQSPEEQMVTYCMLPETARPSRALEFLKFLAVGGLWLTSVGLLATWLPFNLLVGLVGSGSVITVSCIAAKFAVGASLNLTEALSSEIFNKISPSHYFKVWKNLGSNICKNAEFQEEVNSKTDFFEKLKKLIQKEHKKKKFDMDKIIFYFINMNTEDQKNAIRFLSEEQKLFILDYLAKRKPNTINQEVIKLIIESTKLYDDLKTAGNAEEFFKKCEDDELGKKMIALLLISESSESKSLNSRIHLERFKGVLKVSLTPVAFLFCAMWFPFMPVLASLIPMPAVALFGIACAIGLIVISIKKFRNPNSLNPNRNFRNANILKLIESMIKVFESKSEELQIEKSSNDSLSEQLEDNTEKSGNDIEKSGNDTEKSGNDTEKSKSKSLYWDKWKSNSEESKKNEQNKNRDIPEVGLDAGGAELQTENVELGE